jgi:hypothetical protein
MKWRGKLTPKELEHLGEKGLDYSLDEFTVQYWQANGLGARYPHLTRCAVCDSVAEKLGILKKEI